MARRRRRSPARWLAPLALIACAVAVYAVVHNTLSDGSATSTSGSAQSSTAAGKAAGAKGSKKRRRRRTYRVKSGDTLSAISAKTGVSLETIQRLNPRLDADTLRTGQRVKLRP
jgi:LysM repeat protein